MEAEAEGDRFRETRVIHRGEPGVVPHTYDPRMWEAEAGAWTKVKWQFCLR